MLIEPTKLKDHFEQHFAPRNTVTQPEIENPELFPHVLPPNNIQTNEEIPDEEELRNVLKKQKDGKCRGTDEIYSEHLKYSTSKNLLAALLLLISMIWSMVTVPKTWLIAIITCLHKKGAKSIAKNYRSIFIMNSIISKLFPRIIIDRLCETYECLIMNNQFGFRKNRSTTDAIFIVREAIKSTRNPLHL